jgi:hypothetical protein
MADERLDGDADDGNPLNSGRFSHSSMALRSAH